MVPSEYPWLQIVHKMSLSSFTTMIWFKKKDPTLTKMPAIEGMAGGNSMLAWNKMAYPNATQLYWFYGDSSLKSTSLLYETTNWASMTMQLSGGSLRAVVNGTPMNAANISGGGGFGDSINTGRRVYISIYNGYVWDGCLGNFLLFNETLTLAEVMTGSNLIVDDDF